METFWDLKGWQGNALRPQYGICISNEAQCNIAVEFKRTGTQQRKKKVQGPVAVTGRVAKEENIGFHTFKKYKLASAYMQKLLRAKDHPLK